MCSQSVPVRRNSPSRHDAGARCLILVDGQSRRHRLRDFGIGLSDGPHRAAWRIDLHGAVAAVHKLGADFLPVTEDFGMIQSPGPQDCGDRRLFSRVAV